MVDSPFRDGSHLSPQRGIRCREQKIVLLKFTFGAHPMIGYCPAVYEDLFLADRTYRRQMTTTLFSISLGFWLPNSAKCKGQERKDRS